MRYHVTIGGRAVSVDLGPEGQAVEGKAVDAQLRSMRGTPVRSLLVGGASHRLVARRSGQGHWEIHVRGRRLLAEVVDERTRTIREMVGQGAKAAGPKPLTAPMPGLVVKVEVGAGDVVEPGRGLVIVEAMKMENELRADTAATVARVLVQPGQAVEKGQVLIEFEAPQTEGGES